MAKLRSQVSRGIEELAQNPRIRPFRPTAERLGRHELIDRSAALTYYGLLAVVPGVLVLFSVVGLLGTQDTVSGALEIVDEVGPGGSEGPARNELEDLINNDVRSGTLLGVGLIAVLWTASAYVGSFFRASAAIWSVQARPVWRAWPARMALTIAILLLTAVALLAIVVSGQLASSIGDAIGLGKQLVTLYEIAKWPLLLVVAVVIVSGLYRASPSGRRSATTWRLLTPGGAFAVAAWVVLSAGFGVYTNVFASYDSAYGALGTTIASMVWLWLTNLVLLMGVEADAELEMWKSEKERGTKTAAGSG
ncbi:MAG TPA: YihY/virulence factor BrkB family protein [Thermoleophilaceae bacterium]|nr:YihY/virulence factor BrkB family protein [Thermoleophilaceae bacterium]